MKNFYKHHNEEKNIMISNFKNKDILANIEKFFSYTSNLNSNFDYPKQRLLSYEELPLHLELIYDNECIKKGYHPPPCSWKETWGLLWSVHYETINIWSHLIGSFLFIGYLFDDLYNCDKNDYWMNLIYDFASFTTFTFSTLYHWLHIRSNSTHNNCLCLDHFGVEINSFVTAVKFMKRLIGDEKLFDSYVMIQSYGFALAIMLLYRCWRSVEYGKLMNTSFGANVRLLLCPSHVFLLNISIYHYYINYHKVVDFNDCNYLLALLITEILFATATFIYVLKFPESIWPGKFDTYFNSHQIMHVATLLTGIYVKYYS